MGRLVEIHIHPVSKAYVFPHLGDLFLVHSVSLRFSVFLLGCRGRLLGLLLDFGRRLLGLGWRRFGGRRLR